MTLALSLTLHMLAAVIWVGGMFFAYLALRPVAAKLFEPPVRLTLWSHVFQRFFPWVWGAIITLLASGSWLVITLFGNIHSASSHVHIMLVLGLVMVIIFMHLFFSPYKRLNRAVLAQDWPSGGQALNQIRQLIAINLTLGLCVIAIAASGRYF